MNLLEWKSEYAIGDPGVDQEHREMIGLINRFYRQLDEPEDARDIERLLGDIHSTIAAHFALEERQMRIARYAEYVDHKNDHEALLDQLATLMDHHAESPAGALQELRRRLNGWFGVHFSTFDARLHGKLGI